LLVNAPPADLIHNYSLNDITAESNDFAFAYECSQTYLLHCGSYFCNFRIFFYLNDRFIPGPSFPHYSSFTTDPVSISISIKTKLRGIVHIVEAKLHFVSGTVSLSHINIVIRNYVILTVVQYYKKFKFRHSRLLSLEM
jgi:hypothetical protein